MTVLNPSDGLDYPEVKFNILLLLQYPGSRVSETEIFFWAHLTAPAALYSAGFYLYGRVITQQRATMNTTASENSIGRTRANRRTPDYTLERIQVVGSRERVSCFSSTVANLVCAGSLPN